MGYDPAEFRSGRTQPSLSADWLVLRAAFTLPDQLFWLRVLPVWPPALEKVEHILYWSH